MYINKYWTVYIFLNIKYKDFINTIKNVYLHIFSFYIKNKISFLKFKNN